MRTRQNRTVQDDTAAAAAAETPRYVIAIALGELGEPAERISAAAGLPASFLRTYLDRGEPAVLPGPVRRRLAARLGVPEQMLR